jgi:GH15 family glucan-1,4-alpha-glucosidase
MPGSSCYAATADTIRRAVLERGLTPNEELAKSFGRDMVDANLISVAVPHGMFAPDDPLIRRTIARIECDLHPANSGIHRYVEDVYYGGGAWVLLALWLAWYYTEVGEVHQARALFDWAATQADEDGNLPEQVTTTLLSPDDYAPWVDIRGPIARPLLWTHAKYLIVYAALKAEDAV